MIVSWRIGSFNNGIISQTSNIESNKRRIWYVEYLGLSLNALGIHVKSAEEVAAENIIERIIKRHTKKIISFPGWIITGSEFLKLQNDDFEFIFSFPSFSGGKGIFKHQIVDSLHATIDGKNAYADCFHATFSGYFNAKFNLPEKNFEFNIFLNKYSKELLFLIALSIS